MPSSKYDFLYNIFISDFPGNKDSTSSESSRKRKRRDDRQMGVSFIWNVFRKFYCSDGRSKRVVDLDFRTAVFKEIEYWLFTVDDIDVVDEMVTKIGPALYDVDEFDEVKKLEVKKMVHQVREAVVGAFRTGPRREKLDVMVTVQNQIGMPVDEYEAMLRDL